MRIFLMLPNEKFVKTEIIEIFKESNNLVNISCTGIESYPLQEYVLQSTFIKMTGYLEQKIKCICWDIASINYEFRYEILKKWNELGTFSAYEKIKEVYDYLMKLILSFDNSFVIDNSISLSAYLEIKQILKNSILNTFEERKYLKFKNDKTFFENKEFCSFADMYKEYLYRKRNSIAHNTKSYQENLPKLKTLREDENYERSSYYHFFTVLVIYDRIFVNIYEKCINELNENSW